MTIAINCREPHAQIDAGFRAQRRNRITEQHVIVLDGIEAHLDTDGGRWQTFCEAHGEVVSHETLALALAHAVAPEGWCEGCMARVYGPDRMPVE